MKREIVLPPPRLDGPVSLEAAIARRRSVRSYTSGDLTPEELGQLLWAAQGITSEREHTRAAPSAGGRYPLEVYVCRGDGVWLYRPQGHKLVRHLEQDVRAPLAGAAWEQQFISRAPAVLAFCAVPERTTSRYGERGRVRYVAMDAGHAAQNVLLQAVALGLGSVPVGAFEDAQVAKVLSLPPDQEPLYLLPVGHSRG